MNIKIILLLQIGFLVFCFQTPSCGIPGRDSKIQLKGADDRNDLVFFYKKEASYEQRRYFEDEVLGKPRADGRGRDLPDGVIDMSLITNSGYRGFAFNFSKEASDEQRRSLKNKLESSPLVHKVYEDIIPDEIRDLE